MPPGTGGSYAARRCWPPTTRPPAMVAPQTGTKRWRRRSGPNRAYERDWEIGTGGEDRVTGPLPVENPIVRGRRHRTIPTCAPSVRRGDQRLATDTGPGGSGGDSRGRHDPEGPLRLRPPGSPPGEPPTGSQSPHSGPAASTRRGPRDRSAHKHKRSRKEASSRARPRS